MAFLMGKISYTLHTRWFDLILDLVLDIPPPFFIFLSLKLANQNQSG